MAHEFGAHEPGSLENVTYRLRVNGRDHEVAEGWLGESLLYVVRERLGLPGAKNACDQGECGSCSVLMDASLVCACLVLAASAVGAEITTIEGLSTGAGATRGSSAAQGSEALTDVQTAFLEEGAVQCGFCTPGLIMAVHDLLDRLPSPTDLEVREAISGNLCRCTGYGRILAAVEAVAVGRRTLGEPDKPAPSTRPS